MLKKIIILSIAVMLVTVVFAFDLQRFFSLDQFFSHKDALQRLVADHAVLAKTAYFFTYVLVFALALPAGAVLTLAGGALFGLGWGILLVSFASSVGSLLAFIAARFILRDWVRERFRQRIEVVDKGVAAQGAFYLFALRLVPVLPPAVINLAMGVTGMRAWTFYWVSQLGMLAGTAVYVNAGTEIGSLNPSEPILNARLLFAFIALALFPFVVKKLMHFVEVRKRYKGYEKPTNFDNALLVIGAGSGGLVSAYIAAMLRAKVTLVEKNLMGGDCLNTGCVPSKALLRAATVAQTVRNASDFGVHCDAPRIDFNAVMNHVRGAITNVAPHDSIERYSSLGVNCIKGEAALISPWEVEVGGQIISAKKIIVATGAAPKALDIPSIEGAPIYNSDTIWQLDKLPNKLLVLGAGAIGCELAQAFARLGSDVTIVTHGSRLLSKEDPAVSALILESFQNEGIDVRFGFSARVIDADKDGAVGGDENNGAANTEQYQLVGDTDKGETVLAFSHLLVALGREPNASGFGLEELGIHTNDDGGIETDEYLQTYLPNIYAAGDVTNKHIFTHAASHQAWYATVNALFGSFKRFKVDYRLIPRATFTDPEVAHVGLTEQSAKQQGIDYEITRYALDDLDRAIADGTAKGFIQVVTPSSSDKILGVTIVGKHASEVIGEYISVMKRNGRLSDILNTIHIYPTYGEMNKYVAGEWKKAHKPQWALSLLEKFLAP